MTGSAAKSGGASVGHLAHLDHMQASAVIYLRLWCDGPDGQATVWRDFASGLGHKRGRHALSAFEQLCGLCTRYGRRPLIRHAINCACVGADEACFATFLQTATDGDRDDAMLIAILLVRPDVAPLITKLATDVGLALRQMAMAGTSIASTAEPRPAVLH